jgi:hypothetical protein
MKADNRFFGSLRSASHALLAPAPPVATRRPPLAALPNGSLLRSLFIAGVTSKKVLLIPCLKILSFLSRPGRGYLLSVDKNPLIHAILKKTFYNQFCAGETPQETRQCVRRLKDLGFSGVILTYARETVFDHRSQGTGIKGVHGPDKTAAGSDAQVAFCKHIDQWRIGTLETMDLIEDGDYLALK